MVLSFFRVWPYAMMTILISKKISERDFPGGPVVKAPPSNVGGTGLIPGQGTKVPHAMGCSQKLKRK